MALRGPIEGEQLTFSAFALSDAVRELGSLEVAKKEAAADFADQIKAVRKRITKLADEIAEQKRGFRSATPDPNDDRM